MEFTIKEISEIFQELKKKMEEEKDYLIDLDSKVGDGDLGISMAKAFKVAAETIDEFAGEDIGQALMKVAMAMNNAASSTMGTLFSSGILQAGKSVKGKEKIDYRDILEMAEAGVKDIEKRNKAEKGDKTVLDSLLPALQSFRENINNGYSLEESLEVAQKAAHEGVKETEDMVARYGRAQYYGEESRGHKDPGAVAAFIVIKTINNYINKKLS